MILLEELLLQPRLPISAFLFQQRTVLPSAAEAVACLEEILITLTDLIEKTKWCLNNYDKALIIAENAFQFSKLYLTRDACYEKWNSIICNCEL